ncbi:MAG: hypothetical protein CMO55_00180 [Verrucomicrobiales bacterium]|nr:hypothetical protein [Verrucomicrobiales bacterium]
MTDDNPDSFTPGPFESLSAKTPRKSSKKRRGKRRGGWFKRLFFFCFFLGLAAALGGSIYYWFRALKFELSAIEEVPQRTLVFDRKGKILGHVSGHGENRIVVKASDVSENFINALLAREDMRFYEHGGVDYQGVVRAMIANFKSGNFDQGASTLTMQLARNSFTLHEKSIDRKLLEVAIARRIEAKYDKDEILGFYMNRIYFGSGLYGIERASEGFFMKPASQLTPGEGAMLAGIIRGPSLLNPFRNLEDAKATRDEVLERMLAEEMITPQEMEAAKSAEISLRPPDKRLATGSYVLQTVYDLLADYLEPEQIEIGGLKIFTTIDPVLQETAEKSLDSHLTSIESRSGYKHPRKSTHKKGEATKYLQGSVVSLDNSTGGILALVGGRDFGDSSFNRAYQARRQVGSTFKPFVYATAFEKSGLLPGAYVSDNQIRIRHNGGPVWSPGNSDGTFTGLQPAAIGLIRSRNTMSVRVGQIAGLDNVRAMANQLKLGETPDSPVLFLGAFETSNYAITSAYSTFAAKGVNYPPFLIGKIEDAEGKTLYRQELHGDRIIRESVSWITTDILGKVMDSGTGKSARSQGYTAPAYGKTGTTNDYHDAWFVGYTDKVTTGVWVGLDRPQKIMDRGYGSTLALPVWTEVMKAAESSGLQAEAIPAPPGTTPTVLCRECGLLQGSGNRTLYPYQMNLPPDLKPRGTCRGHGGGLFTNRNREPQAFQISGELPAGGYPQGNPPPPPGESGIGKALRGLGKFIFGGGR